jgi:RND family efflux transporter MFP subunit
VVTIADLKHLEVDCDVKEDYISRVVPGAPAEVAVDAVPDVRYKGRVRKIIPMGDRARATIKVKVELLDADKRLFPDMSATAYFLPQEDAEATAESDVEQRVFCEAAAVQTDEKGTYVWIIGAAERAQRIDVEVGEKRDARVEILSGLAGGERVIAGPFDQITAGTLVKVRE